MQGWKLRHKLLWTAQTTLYCNYGGILCCIVLSLTSEVHRLAAFELFLSHHSHAVSSFYNLHYFYSTIPHLHHSHLSNSSNKRN